MAGTLASLAAAGAAGAAWAISHLPDSIQQQLPILGGSTTATLFANNLAPLLSPTAEICLAGSDCFVAADARWIKNWNKPHLDIVVRPSCTQDVAETIKAANAAGKPFLAVSGGHGANLALGKVRNGVGIWLKGLKGVEVLPGGQTARVGGGVESGELLRALWDVGKMSVVGGCECTGAVAPMLGGGHGWLQGRYGLMLDNLVQATLVTADGRVVQVGEGSEEELFWGLRGAGHNFGIVTEFEYKIYDRTPENENWSYETFVFSGDKLEQVFTVANSMLGGVVSSSMPTELVHWGLIGKAPKPDPEATDRNSSLVGGMTDSEDASGVIITFTVLYQGTSIPSKFTTPLRDIGPLAPVSGGTTDLPGYAQPAMLSYDSPFCAKNGPTLQRFPVSLEKYSVSALRKTADIIASLPDELSHAALIVEAFSLAGVQSVPEEATAYPDRANSLLLSPFMIHGEGRAVSRKARLAGESMREALVEGSGKALNAYVNYAHGSESAQALYGYEGWRLERLRALKRVWDPENRFGFYLPIEV